ncbi:MAG: CoA ester lyase [Mycobacterium sp.]|nr:MAG: CoA ester lyase [Mycobacterium sp.]PJE23998.1 MAG: CoA ester lyase [Mycobacterium sp.]
MNRLRRSELATPASNLKMIAKAAASDADLVFLDLEDAVAPAEKVQARENAIAALHDLDWGRTTRAVRVNAVGTDWAHDDIAALVSRAGDVLDVIILPKVLSARDVWFVETMLDVLEARHQIATPIALEVLIEEAEALRRVDEIAAASKRLEALIIGQGDLAASLGVRFGHVADPATAYPGDVWHFARSQVTAAAKAAGLDAVDGPFPDFTDVDGYRREATWTSTLGMTGKWAIHPSQVGIANEVFAPTETELALAQQMCDAYTAAQARGDGSAGSSGLLVDAASVRLFQAVLDRHHQITGA